MNGGFALMQSGKNDGQNEIMEKLGCCHLWMLFELLKFLCSEKVMDNLPCKLAESQKLISDITSKYQRGEQMVRPLLQLVILKYTSVF